MKVLNVCCFSILLMLNVYGASRTELLNLEEDAVVFGQGPNQVYAFVDPMCSKSKDYIALISTQKKLLKQNTYYVFLHRLEKFKSDKVINYIYEVNNPKEALLEVMVDDKELTSEHLLNTVKAKRHRIDTVADSTGMTRRPYLLIYPAGSNICKVSEGSAPCMLDW